MDVRIVGLDIRPNRESFALAILNDDRLTVRTIHITELFKVLEEISPDIIAIDDESEFSGILERIVEYTGATIVKAGVRGRRIYETAKELGLWQGGHPSPSQTAVLVAKLAKEGIYETVIPGIRETIIRISPERSSYKGGREGKYSRSLRVFIEHAKDEIESRLKALGVEYDSYPRGSGYEIRAYDRLPTVREALRRISVSDVRLDIYASKPRKGKIKGKFIVGLDPGTHVGLAFLNIYGGLAHTATLEGGRESVISYIRSIGDPIIIAVDVPEVPSFVKRVATALNSPIYTPDSPILIEEKRRIAAEYGLKGTSHERDALTAAVRAYYRFKNKIDRAIKAAREYGLNPEEVVYRVMRNYSVTEAVSKLLPKPKKQEEKKVRRRKTRDDLEREIEHLRDELRRLRIAYNELRRKYDDLKLEYEIRAAEVEMKLFENSLIRNQRIRIEALESEVEKLNKQIEDLESIIRRISDASTLTLSGRAIGKYLDNLTYNALEEIKPASILDGDVVFLRGLKSDRKGMKLIKDKIGILVVPKSILKDARRMFPTIPVIAMEDIKRKRIGGLVLFDKETLDKALKRLEEEEQNKVEKEIKNIIFELSG